MQRTSPNIQIGCVERLVDRHARSRAANKEALVEVGACGRRALTYRQLQILTRDLARSIRIDLGGSRASQNIALVGSSTLELLCAWLAVMRAGHTAFLVHPNQPPEHYEALWDECDPALILTDRTVEPAVGERLPRIENLLECDQGSLGDDSGSRTFDEDLDDARPALCLLSSGSTGLPKICVHAHRAFGHFERAVSRAMWDLKPGDRIMGTSGPYFSFGLQGVHPALSLGATAVLVPEWTDHTRFLEVMEQERVTVTLAVPTLYHLLVQRAKRRYRLDSLRLSLSAGERLPPIVRQRWEQWSGSIMIDSIGTTETFSPYFSQTADGRGGFKDVPGFEYSVAAAEAPGPVGTDTFTVAVSGPTMMLGYYTRWASTHYEPLREKFETKDLFSRDDAGWHYVSRNSERIKVAGHWVSPQELEEFLLLDPRVALAGAVPIETAEGLTRLRAFIVLREEARPDERRVVEELMQAARDRLRPKALRPDSIRAVAALQTTPSGKMRRAELHAIASGFD